MKLRRNQRLEIAARALIFRQDHILITEWQDGYAFLIGGRVEHGETLHAAVLREVQEETGAKGQLGRLLYFAEKFRATGGEDWHEYGWFYLVETDDPICPLDAVIPNPDNPNLVIRWVPLAEVPTLFIYPLFLKHYLPADYRSGFCQTPRHFVTDRRVDPPTIVEIDDGMER